MNETAPPPRITYAPRPLPPRNVPPRPADAPPVLGWRERPRIPRVGAPPAVVEAGAPGAREEVRAYAERIHQAWAAFFEADVRPWAAKHFGVTPGTPLDPTAVVVGDVMGGDAGELAAQKKRAELFDAMLKHRAAFEAYRESISGFDVSGPSPSQAWQRLQTFESTLKGDRAKLAALGGKVTSEEPGQLEAPGGVQQGLGQLEGTIKVVTGGVVFLGGVYLLGKVLGR